MSRGGGASGTEPETKRLTSRGLTWAKAAALSASPSLSDSSSLLLSESASHFATWAATALAFRGSVGTALFAEGPVLVAEAALTWEFFPEGFAWE